MHKVIIMEDYIKDQRKKRRKELKSKFIYILKDIFIHNVSKEDLNDNRS